jgi:hypothetical protein
MKHLTAPEARAFADKWLPAWSGNNPELLASFYGVGVRFRETPV